MELTRQNLLRERERAIKQHIPMRIKQCRICEEIKSVEGFTKKGAKRNICRDCARQELKAWKESEGYRSRLINKYHAFKCNAKRRGIDVGLSSTEFESWLEAEREEGACFYCQGLLDFDEPHSLQGLTIDRMDTTKGYTIGNMVVACRRCNVIKGNWFTFDEMIELAEKYLIGREY